MAKEEILVTYKEAPIRLSVDFSSGTLQARRDWQEIFQAMETKDLQPRRLYPARLSFKMESEIKSFPDPPPKKKG